MPRPNPPTLSLLRSFSTTPPTCKSVASLSRTRMPPYPYGPAQHYKQSNSGLYGGSTIQFGNQVSSKNAIKTRRVWRPNIHQKRLWSDALGKFISVRVQARVLRTIDKVGGLDEYLLGDKPARVKELGVEGWRLRWKVLRSERVRGRWEAERRRLGVPVGGYVSRVGMDGGVEGEVERVGGEIVEQMERGVAEVSGLEDEAFRVGEGEDETADERVERTSSDIEDGNGSSIDQSGNWDTGKEHEVPRQLVGLREKGREEVFSADGETKQATGESGKPDLVQADDSRSIFSRLRGMLRR